MLSAICILAFMHVMFAVALLLKNNGIADIGWGLGFIVVALVTFFCFGDNRAHQKVITFLVVLWGLRLSLYLLIRNWGKPEDFRYANWRKEWGNRVFIRSYLQVFLLQGLVMFVNSLPIVVVNSDNGIHDSWKYLYPAGTMLWLVGFMFETIGDWQMYCFKTNPHPHKNKVMNKGLWRYTRHPNYFGEAQQWWGIFLLAIPSGMWYVSVLAPVTITWLLLKVSGVTMLEKKYEGDDEYSLYKKNTPAFFPWFPKQ